MPSDLTTPGGDGTIPMMASAVTVLPLPDSSDQSKRLTRSEGQRHIGDRPHDAATRNELDTQALHLSKTSPIVGGSLGVPRPWTSPLPAPWRGRCSSGLAATPIKLV